MSWEFTASQSDYVSVADAAVLSVGNNAFSIAGWVKAKDLGASPTYHQIFHWGDYLATPDWHLWINTASDEPRMYIRDDDGSFINGMENTNDSTLTEDTWHHIIITKSAAGVADWIMYVDNTQVDSVISGQDMNTINVAEAWEWGRDETPNYADIDLAEWAFWDGTLLTSTDRSDLQTKEPDNLTDAGTPTWYIPMYDDFNSDVGSLSITNNGATANSSNHPITPAGASSTVARATLSHLGTRSGSRQIIGG